MTDTTAPASLERLIAGRIAAREDPTLPGIPSTIRYDFGQGLPAPESFPTALLADLTTRVLADEPTVLEYFDPTYGEREMVRGRPGLREQIATMTNAREPTNLGVEDVMLVAGSMDGIAHLATAVLEPGDGVVVEAISYHRPVQMMRFLGATVATVTLDDDGLDPDDVDARLAELSRNGHVPKLIYTISTFHSPLGVSLSFDRRRRLLEVAEKWNVLVVEDDVYVRLRYEGAELPSMAGMPGGDRVVHVESFSKTIAPGLRLAWLTAPPAILRATEAARSDLGVSQLTAAVVERVLAEGHYESHLARVNDLYRQKRDITLAALDEHLSPYAHWRVPEGSMYLWVEMDDSVDVPATLARANELGVLARPGSLFSMQPGWADQGVRLCFGRVPADDLAEGVALLGQATRETIGR